MDSEDYYKGAWSNNLRDTDQSLWLLYQNCVSMGLECAMYAPTAMAIHTRVESILTKLRTDPVPFYNPDTDAYGSVDYSLVRRTMFTVLYSPVATGPMFFRALAQLEQGDAELLWLITGSGYMQSLITQRCVCPASSISEQVPSVVPSFAIACGDAGNQLHTGIAQLRKDYEKMTESSSFAECWGMRMGCS